MTNCQAGLNSCLAFMIAKIVYDNRSSQLYVPSELLPESGKYPHHLTSTNLDNLCEIAGKTCYDSLINPKGRASSEYHKHLAEVGHTSVWRHAYLTFKILAANNDVLDVFRTLICRPGVFFHEERAIGGSLIYVSINLCAILEWDKFLPATASESISREMQFAFLREAKKQAPFVCAWQEERRPLSSALCIEPCVPVLDKEVWVSFFLSDISRTCSMELIRHSTHYAVSQRSTRYVDEADNAFINHPVYQKYEQKFFGFLGKGKGGHYGKGYVDQYESDARCLYREAVECFQDCLVDAGEDKFTARKQARGAARRFLPSNLSTELIYSCSLWQAKELLRQRLPESADLEIRQLANQMHALLKDKFPTAFRSL